VKSARTIPVPYMFITDIMKIAALLGIILMIAFNAYVVNVITRKLSSQKKPNGFSAPYQKMKWREL
jgi:hypothetical protein